MRVTLHSVLDKFGQHGDYSQSPLPPELQKYAALDALVSRVVYEKLIKKLPSPCEGLVYKGPGRSDLQIGFSYEVYLYSKIVGNCTLVSLPRKSDVTTIKWGASTVKSGNAIIRI